MNYLDYTYYRVTDFYKKKKDSSAEFTSAIIISVLQSFILIDIFVLARIIWEYKIPDTFSKYWFLPLYVILLTTNWFKYVKPKKYRDYRKLWKDEQKPVRRQKGWYIVLTLIICISIPIIYGFIRHNIIGGKSFF